MTYEAESAIREARDAGRSTGPDRPTVKESATNGTSGRMSIDGPETGRERVRESTLTVAGVLDRVRVFPFSFSRSRFLAVAFPPSLSRRRFPAVAFSPSLSRRRFLAIAFS